MNQKGQFGIATIWGVIGFIFAILDAFDLVQLGILTLDATKCAQTSDLLCLNDGLAKIMLFFVDIVIGPLLLAANFANTGGLIGGIICVIILYVVYVKKP